MTRITQPGIHDRARRHHVVRGPGRPGKSAQERTNFILKSCGDEVWSSLLVGCTDPVLDHNLRAEMLYNY